MAITEMRRWIWVIFLSGFLATLCLSASAFFFYWRAFSLPAESFDLQQIFSMEKASVVFDRNGKKMGEFFIQNRLPVALGKVPRKMIEAVLATEDQRFWQHKGVDLRGIARAATENMLSGRIAQGGSTITQQLARNAFDLRGRSYHRKLLEIALALRIERHLSKDQILEAYLNRVYFGSGFYGVEAASQGYFGKPSEMLDLSQCAQLASLLKSPNQLSPRRNPQQALEARNVVLEQMREIGAVGEEDCEKAKRSGLSLASTKSSAIGSYPLEMVRQKAVKLLGYEKIMVGGLKINTSLDLDLQMIMEESASRLMSRLESSHRSELIEILEDYENRSSREKPPQYLQLASIVLENSTGGILSLVGGRDFSHSEYNRATQMRRPPALAFSPFLLLASFQEGLFAGSVFSDSPLDNKFVGVGGAQGILGEWGVETTENSYEGLITLREAFAKGKNSALARLGFVLGSQKIADLSSSLGMSSENENPMSSISLGTSPVAPSELALAYTVLPRGGSIPDNSYLIEKILDSEGALLFAHKTREKKIVPPHVVFQVHSMLEEGMTQGPASKLRGHDLLNPVAVGRSGTSYDFQDLWFAGYDSKTTAVVWIGSDRPSKVFHGAFGSDLSASLWSTAMNWSETNSNPQPLLPPVGLVKVSVCPSSGQLSTPECKKSLGAPPPREEYDKIDAPVRKMCHVHSVILHPVERKIGDSPWPKATQVVDLRKVRPVGTKSQPVEGYDPYDSSFYLTQKAYDTAPALPSTDPASAPSPTPTPTPTPL